MARYRYQVGTAAIKSVDLAQPVPRDLPPAMRDVMAWEALAPAVAMPVPAVPVRFEVA